MTALSSDMPTCGRRAMPRSASRVRSHPKSRSASPRGWRRKPRKDLAEASVGALASRMVLYILQRLGVLAATLVAASLIVFAVMNILPGNAAETMLGSTATPEAVAALAHKLGLDQPAPVRYAHWIGGAFRGDLGVSY